MISRSAVNEALKAGELLTIEEQCDVTPYDGFMAHAAVRSLESLEQWCRMGRETYLYLKSAHDLGLTKMSEERYDEVLGILSQLHQFHANVRQVIRVQELTEPQISEKMDTSDNEEGHY